MKPTIRDGVLLLIVGVWFMVYAIADHQPKHRVVLESPAGKWQAEIFIDDCGNLIARTVDITQCPETCGEK